jgi:hypothetical protein
MLPLNDRFQSRSFVCGVFRILAGALPCCALSILVAGNICLGAAEPMQFRGSMDFTQSPPTGDPNVQHLFFRAEISDRRWRIRTAKLEQDLDGTMGAYFSDYFDGTNQWVFYSLGQDLASHSVAKHGGIKKGEFPMFAPSRSTFVWIALASKNYLRSENYARCRPLWTTSLRSFTDDRGYLQTRMELLPNSGLPKDIRFTSDGHAFPDIPNPTKDTENIRYPPPFDKGFLHARYITEAVTNVNGFYYPTEFELEVFNPKPDAKSTSDLYAVWDVRGTVSEIKELDSVPDLRPEMSDLMELVDYRTASDDVPPIHLLTGSWDNNPRDPNRRMLGNYTVPVRKNVSHQTGIRNVLVILMLLLVIAVAFAALKRMKTDR